MATYNHNSAERRAARMMGKQVAATMSLPVVDIHELDCGELSLALDYLEGLRSEIEYCANNSPFSLSGETVSFSTPMSAVLDCMSAWCGAQAIEIVAQLKALEPTTHSQRHERLTALIRHRVGYPGEDIAKWAAELQEL